MNTAQVLKERSAIRDAGVDFTTSSGLEMKIKYPDVPELVALGIMPVQLISKFEELSKTADMTKVEQKDLDAFKTMVEKIVTMTLIAPKVVKADPKADEILLSDLNWTEKQEIFRAVVQMPKEVANFRQEKRQSKAV